PVKGISTVVHLYSDGRFAKLTDASLANLSAKQTGNRLLGNLNLHYHRAGEPGKNKVDNLGITSLSAVRILDKKAKANLDVGKLKVLVQVNNYRDQPASVRLHLDVYAGRKLIHPAQMTLRLSPRTVKKADPDADEEDKDVPGEVLHPQTAKPDPPIF